MAWKKFENETWKPTKKGEVLEGTYITSRAIITPNGTSKIYRVRKKDGGEVEVWGTHILDRFFGAMPIGAKVRLTYQGKLKSGKGREYHAFDLEYDADQVEKLREQVSTSSLTEEDIEEALL